ncbi:MAG: cytochrome bc complex cytochrome b subunit [Chloroflexi bacterium]|nr:cytochrome bc complex cytochrome b subunit [Chloroflexota bacterium]
MTQPNLVSRVRRSIRRQTFWGENDRDRMHLTVSDLVLHLHPRTVPAASLRFTYTFGLGGLAILLLAIMVVTGILLMFAYTPSTDMAYTSIIGLGQNIWFGQLIRNLHHWSANLLLIVAGLHMLRVLYTGAFHTPREFNWQIGLALLGLVIAANFTGYLLPWDQLGYWAVTVATSLIDSIPLVGHDVRIWLLGGDQVNETTLHNFYVLHVMLIPLGLLIATSFHIWRVRKDGISVPRGLKKSGISTEKLTTIPHLISREFVFGLLIVALLLAWATWIDAPLGASANPNQPPNPTKTTWYFMGLQEFLLHVYPSVAGVTIIGLLIIALMLLPYWQDTADSTGIWFRSKRARWICAVSFPIGVGIALSNILLTEISTNSGILPLMTALLLIGFYAWVLRRRGADAGEIRLALITLVSGIFVTLTIVGIGFRGEGMALRSAWS